LNKVPKRWRFCRTRILAICFCFLVSTSLIAQSKSNLDEAEKLEQEGIAARKAKQYLVAERLLRHSLEIREKELGPDDSSVANCLNLLNSVYIPQGKYGEAETYCCRILKIKEKKFTPQHLVVANALFNLATVLSYQEKYTEAEITFRQCLKIREAKIGVNHPKTLECIVCLANVLYQQGKYQEAELLYRQSLKEKEASGRRTGILTSIVHTEEPDLTTSLIGLANVLVAQRKYSEAELLYRQSLKKSQARGCQADILFDLNHIGDVLFLQGKYVEAEGFYRQGLELEEKHNEDHSERKISLMGLEMALAKQGKFIEAESVQQRRLKFNNQASQKLSEAGLNLLGQGEILAGQGRYAEAEGLICRALEIKEKTFGRDSLEVTISLNNLACLHYSQGKLADAEAEHRRCLKIRELFLDPNHIDLAISLSNLAIVLIDLGKFAEAEGLIRRALEIKEKTFGCDSLEVTTTLNNLACLLHSQGKFAYAEAEHRRCLKIMEKFLEPTNPEVLTSLNNLGTLLRDQGKFAEAEELFRRNLMLREKIQGQNNPDIALGWYNLAEVLVDEGAYSQAEEVLYRSLKIREATLDPFHPAIAQTLGALAGVLEKQCEYFDAEAFYRISLKIYEKAVGKNHPGYFQTLGLLTLNLVKQGKIDEAEIIGWQSLKLGEARLGSDHFEIAGLLNNLALALQKQDKNAGAEQLLRRSLGIGDAILGPNHRNVALVLSNLALVLQNLEKYSEAEVHLWRALEVFDSAATNVSCEDISSEIRSNQRLACSNYLNLLREWTRKSAHAAAGKANHAMAAMEIGRTRQFLDQILSRSASLRTGLSEIDLQRETLLNRQVNDTRRQYLNESAKPQDNQKPNLIGQFETRLATLRVAQIELKKEFSEKYPRFMDLRQPASISVDQIQSKLLRKGECMISWWQDEGVLYACTITPDFYSFRWVPLTKGIASLTNASIDGNPPYLSMPTAHPVSNFTPASSSSESTDVDDREKGFPVADPATVTFDLQAYVLRFCKAIASQSGVQEFRTASYALYRKTVEPFLPPQFASETITLYLVPHGVLSMVPFEALVTSERGETFADLEYLFRKFRIVYTPSARVLRAIRQDLAKGLYSHPDRDPILLLGDPVYTENQAVSSRPALGTAAVRLKDDLVLNPRALEYIRVPGIDQSSRNNLTPAIQEGCKAISLVQLPNSRAEVLGIAGLYKVSASGTGPLVLLGMDAQESKLKNLNLRKRLSNFRILHFATHAIFPDEIQGLSEPCLALSLFGDPENDGLLKASEILDMHLDADLVTLSACQTGIDPDPDFGQGVSELSRAFFYAGTPRLLVSLWNLCDFTTSVFMKDFYSGLQQRTSTNSTIDVLNAIRERFLRSRCSEPFYWAPFILQGEWR